MYQPISFNVIVQALDWHGVKRPTLRQLSFNDRLEDTVTSEYLATWPRADLPDDLTLVCHGDSTLYCLKLQNLLEECFCRDVDVLHVQYSPFKDEFSASLYVTVERGMEDWAAWLDRTAS